MLFWGRVTTVIGTHFATLIAALALLGTSASAAEPHIPQMFVGDWCIVSPINLRDSPEIERAVRAFARAPQTAV